MVTWHLGNRDAQDVVRRGMISKVVLSFIWDLGQVLIPQERLIPPAPALSLPRKIGCAVAAGILHKCCSFFYHPFLLIRDLLHFLLLQRLLILALQLQPVSSFAEKLKMYNTQPMFNPRVQLYKQFCWHFSPIKGRKLQQHTCFEQGFSSFGNCSAWGDLSYLLALLKQKLFLPLLKHIFMRNEPSKEWDTSNSGCSWQPGWRGNKSH